MAVRAVSKLVTGLALVLTAALLVAPLPAVASAPLGVAEPRLTNLSHLDFLTDRVAPPAAEGHTTYRFEEEREIGVLWTYAEPGGDGDYERVGGGAYDPAENTYGQGAFNADDVSRAAVAYVRHWQLFGDDHSREEAYQLLRGLAYLQTAEGEHRGNVVLWMQPDGTLNPSAEPADQPDPSDSGPSYWLARSLWAFGEGYAAFAEDDPAFAQFLKDRFDLALEAVDRQVLEPRAGSHQTVDGLQLPAWLIANGADASAEALYGLSAYLAAAPENALAGRALESFGDGIAEMAVGDPWRWPYGALLPWAESRSVWHAWGDQMAGALSTAGAVAGRKDWIDVAAASLGSFSPHLLAQGGPDHSWMPTPAERSQIAYGVDATLQNLLRTAQAADRPGLRELASFAGAWYFGNNPAGEPMYSPETGRTFDGVTFDGEINRNAGAESTIHGVLSMLALDAHPDVARRAHAASRGQHVTWELVEAEDGDLSGDARPVTPDSAWTGESLWSGDGYVELGPGGRLSVPVTLQASDQHLVLPVFHRQELPAGDVLTVQTLGSRVAGVQDHGGAGEQGISATSGFLDVGRAGPHAPSADGAVLLGATHVGPSTQPARLDAFYVTPRVEWLALAGPAGGQALMRSFSHRDEERTIQLQPGSRVTISLYDHEARLLDELGTRTAGGSVDAPVAPGGFTVVRSARLTERIAGADRIDTAIAASRHQFGDGEAGVVVLARSDLYADALAAPPLAVAEGGPLLLTRSADLHDEVAAELQRVLPAGGSVLLLGGPAALAPKVEESVRSLGFTAERVEGRDRVETALAIAERLGHPDTLLIATGYDFPDALTAGAAAAAADGAVLLTSHEAPHPRVTAYLDAHGEASPHAVGGPAARAYPDAIAVFGQNRDETAVAVAEAFFDAPAAVGFARRDAFPDALTGGAHVGALGAPMLLTARDGPRAAVATYLCGIAAGIDAAYVYGGDAAVSEAGRAALDEHLAGESCAP